VRDHRGRLNAVARGHPAEIEGLLDMLFVAHPAGDARGLLRRVGKQMPHAALVQPREGAAACRRAKVGPKLCVEWPAARNCTAFSDCVSRQQTS